MKKSKARMKSKITSILLVLGVLTIFFSNFIQIIDETSIFEGKEDTITIEDLKSSYFNLTMNPIAIDGNATGIGAHNWTWAESKPWCKGNGSLGDPYRIENLTINGNNASSCIEIVNSNVYFEIRNCTLFNSNGTLGEAGIKLINTTFGYIEENNISFNNIGISLYYNNVQTSIVENQITNNTAYGVLILNSTVGNSDNQFYQNNFSGNLINAFDNKSTAISWNTWGYNTVFYKLIGNYWDNYSGSDANDDGIGDTYHPIPGSGYAYDVMPVCRDGYDGGTIFVDDSGDLTHHITWEWASTLAWCDGQGTHGDPYMIKDLVINGTNTKSCIKVKNSEAIFKIQNCTLFNATDEDIYGTPEAAIYLENVKNANLLDNNCSNNNRYGIYLIDCNDTMILGNTINDNGGSAGDGGLTIETSTFNYYISNNITIENNRMRSNVDGIAISGSGHSISSNIVSNNTNNGLVIFGIGHDVRNNTALNNTNGFSFISTHNSTIENNTADMNSEYGISLVLSNGNVVNNNTASNNVYPTTHATYATGIYLTSSDNNNVTNNFASNNSQGGIIVEKGNNNTIENNTLNYNGGFGLYISEANYTRVERNDLINNTLYGIIMISSIYNDILRNNASLNLDRGIVLLYSDWNTFMNNTVNNNTNYGFNLEDSNYNNITGNTIIGNGIRCIYAHNCYDGNYYSYNGDCTPLIELDPLPPEPPGTPPPPPIPGYDLLILIGTISVISLIFIKKKRK